MKDFKLRDYQVKTARAIDEALKRHPSTLVVGPPGIGKGTQIAYDMAKMLSRRKRSLFVVHRDVLVSGENSLAQRLMEQMKVPREAIGYVMGGKEQINRYIMLATVQSVNNRKLIMDTDPRTHFERIYIDEAHRVRPPIPGKQDGMYQQLLKKHPNSKLVGFTATPERQSNREPLGLVFKSAIHIMTHGQAVSNRFLVPSRVIEPITPDLTGVRVRAGEYNERDLEEKVYNLQALEEIADKLEENWRQGDTAIVYTVNSVKSCELMRDVIRARGFRCESITAATPREERTAILAALGRKQIDVVVNVNVLSEGVSVDSVNIVVLAYSTLVRSKFIQTSTRASRPLWGKDGDWLKDDSGDYLKPGYLVIDCGNNTSRFGKVEMYLSEGVDLSVNTTYNKKKKPPVKRCVCGEIIPAATMVCPTCCFEFPRKEEDKLLAGETEWTEIVSGPMSEIHSMATLKKSQLEAAFGNRKMPHLLLPLALIKNYPLSWAVKVAVDKGYLNQGIRVDGQLLAPHQIDIRAEEHWSAVMQYLDDAVDRYGYRQLLNEIMQSEGFDVENYVSL